MAKVKIYITPKKGVLDPQGKTVESALHSLGYKKVSGVHIGKYIELDLTTDQPSHPTTKKLIDEMCKKLLANMVIEDYRYEVE
ncbi:MAG: phosphoribosylformylglycinamidine synthase subunit PurS [Candidatus Margulisbacteria bacterium]|nr:phosphoribosylformylglycinamidine synthase subunit PurS [Candidatus Margulisiibacteriota bacterium]